MPFTVSHTVAVIPLYKYLGKFGALSALIIGSMTPDFAYMVPYLVHQRMDSHSLVGIYLFAIPMGLTVYFVYHLLMAPVLVSLLPKFIQRHLHSDLFVGRIPNIPSYTLVFSLVIGALTHITWDFFTHQSGIPQHIAWMDLPLTSIDGYEIMPYRVLQHFSTLFGLSLLIFWVWKWISRNKHITSSQQTNIHWQAPKSLKLFSFIALTVTASIFGIINGMANTSGTTVMYGLYDAQVFLRFGIVGAAGAFIMTCALLGLIYQFFIIKAGKARSTPAQ
ncbi:MAG: DUF4184 family protein [Cocleimonas sp.]